MINIKKIITSVIYTILITLISLIFTSILYYFNITSDKLNKVLIYLTSIISMFTGSLILSKYTKKRGIACGSLYFTGWFVLLILLSLVFKTDFNLSMFIYFVILLIFSMLGGIIGKNFIEEKNSTN